MDPKDRWAIVQTSRPLREAPSFDLAEHVYQALGRITLFDLRAPTEGTPLLEAAGDGVVVGAPSPDGESVIVHRVLGHDRELGVLTIKDRSVRWSGLTTEPSVFGATAVWVDNRQVLVASVATDGPRRRFGRPWQSQAASAAAWAAAARDESAVTVSGTGRLAHQHPPAPKGALSLWNARTGDLRTIVDREVVDYELSPDRSLAAVLIAEEEAAADDQVQVATPLLRTRLLLAPLTKTDVKPLAPGLDVSTDLLAWSPDSKGLLVVARRDGASWPQAEIWRINIDGTPPRSLCPRFVGGEARKRVAAGSAAAWLGGRPVVAPVGEWFDPASGTRYGRGQLVATDGKALFLKEHDKLWRVDRGGRRLEVKIAARALRRDPEAAGRVQSSPSQLGAADWGTVASPLADGWVFDQVTHETGVTDLVGHRGDKRRTFMSINTHLASSTISRPLPVRHPNAEGALVTSWLFLPPEKRATPKPLIVLVYPGDWSEASLRRASRANPGFTTNVHLLTGQGYPVLMPTLPFEDPTDPQKGLAEAMLRAVDAAGAQHGVPIDRLVLWGRSFGGWAALMAAQQSNRFGASVAVVPVSNFLGLYGSIDPISAIYPQYFFNSNASWFDTARGGVGGPPWVDPQRHLRNSPALFANRQHAPVLIAHGDLDFLSNDARQMFGMIRRAGGDAELRTYHGSEHELMIPSQLRDFYDRAFNFIDEVLPPTGEPRSPAPTPPPPVAARPDR
ncbi:prolyl oligopeptidase family serine peptidase [Caulobacter sp. 73W]|uniref:Prolyl oligopeptidase family serine peptidase n=1 Tax=Caulobacter sp. 73W TaxID=3161137 RepID=A0AB39KRF4_9CAUL